jgi:hypothetical protein
MAAAGMAIAGGVELAKLALQIYFMSMQTAGKTQAEMLELYKTQEAYFIANPPQTLPDVE